MGRSSTSPEVARLQIYLTRANYTSPGEDVDFVGTILELHKNVQDEARSNIIDAKYNSKTFSSRRQSIDRKGGKLEL